MKFILSVFLLIIGFGCLAQQKVLLEVSSLPVKAGKIYDHSSETEHCRGCSNMDGIEIITTSDSVYSICDGKVATALDLGGGEWAVIIHGSDGLFYTYVNLNQPELKKGAIVTKNQFLGELRTNEEGKRVLWFIITDKKARSFNDEKTVQLLRQMQTPCTNNLQVFVSR